jgi:hypothetical protein
VHELDPSFDIVGGWKRTGVGDLTIMAEWQKDFPQPKPLLKSVQVNTRLGMSMPTASRANPNELFAYSFGNDGATGLIFAGTLNLNFADIIWAGFDVELTHIFDVIRTRRIKTAIDQTDFFLLAKTCVHLDWGMVQRFNLFVGADNLIRGLSLAAYYQFLKHGRTDIIVVSGNYDTKVANTAESLRDWVSHTIICRAKYNFGAIMREDRSVIPSLTLFAKVPFKGRRAALYTTFGAMAEIAF